MTRKPMPDTTIVTRASALSRAVDRMVKRGAGLSKNALLNCLSAAIAGEGHDWGFLKRRPDGLFVQPGCESDMDTPSGASGAPGRGPAMATTPDTRTTPAPTPHAWYVLFDEDSTWSRGLTLHANKAAALDHVRSCEPWWHDADTESEEVLRLLSERGSWEGPADDAELHEDDRYRIEIGVLSIETGAEDTPLSERGDDPDGDVGSAHLSDSPGPGANEQGPDGVVLEEAQNLFEMVARTDDEIRGRLDDLPGAKGFAEDIPRIARAAARAWIADNDWIRLDPDGVDRVRLRAAIERHVVDGPDWSYFHTALSADEAASYETNSSSPDALVWIVEVTRLVETRHLDSDDRDEAGNCGVDGLYRVDFTRNLKPGSAGSTPSPERVLDMFHEAVPISCLEDYDISVRPATPEERLQDESAFRRTLRALT